MTSGTALVVDDDAVNRLFLSRRLQDEGIAVTAARNGLEALEILAVTAVDIVLLDILMPVVDGFEVLRRVKSDPRLRRIPVIVISSLDEMDSVVRCIEMGAEDYLPKPFDPVLLRARLSASLGKKRLEDLEQEYLEQVARVVHAAGAVEAGTFEPESLDDVGARTDALGQLARVFQSMAREVVAREQRLRREVSQLRIEIDEARAARRVAEITETDYFVRLQQRADELRIGTEP